jgi:DNA polymerase-3 subunit delta
MTILIYGQDTYRLRRKLNEIIGHYKKIRRSGLNLRFFEGKELNFEDFCNEFSSVSMFSEKKLFVLKDVFSDQAFKEKFIKNSKKFINAADIILFCEGASIPESDRLLRLLKKTGKSQEFEPLGGISLKNWIKKEFEKRGARVGDEIVIKLADYVGNNDSWQLANEIQKLIDYRGGKDITVKDVELLVKPRIETHIFKTIDAIASGNKKRAIELLHKHLEKGDNLLYLLSMINYQFRNLLVVRELIEKNQPYYSLRKKTGLSPFVIKKSYEQAQRFTLPELKKIYRKIFQADIDIKTGRTEPETALDLLLAGI